jgi:DNA-binding winged helix-turn-helix (wHTH) protein
MVIASSSLSDKEPLKAHFGRFEIDEAEARLRHDGGPVRLAPKPFAVLCELARRPQSLVTKGALLDAVWGHQFVSESVLKTTISDVRAALGDDPKRPRYIETVSSRGYRFIGTAIGAPRPPAVAQLQLGIAAPRRATTVGRLDAFEQLRAAWRLAGRGRRQLAWITGEAGVGKTTLIERFMHEVGDAACAHGHCVANCAAAEPHLPILEALTGLSRRDPSLAQLIREVAPTWLLQLPWLSSASERARLRSEVADVGQARMLREMAELLDRYTAERPLLLVTEDLQWADPATVQLMDYVGRRRSGARLMWLASFRLTEVIAGDHPLATLRHELRLHGLGREIVLDAFSPAEVAEYVAGRVPALAADAALMETLWDRTDGLPLFLANVVDELVVARSDDEQPPVHDRPGSMAIPDTLTALVERYVQELTPGQRVLLEAASVCGTEFRLSALADVLDAEIAVVGAGCADLARRQRWLRDASAEQDATSDSVYAFRQGLYREVLYWRLDPLARVDLQRRVAATLDREREESATPPQTVTMAGGGHHTSFAHATA